MTSARRQNIYASDRLDVLEDEIPRGICSVRGCGRGQPLYPWAGAFGTFYICSRHRPLYRKHDQILKRIRSFQDRDILGG